MKGSGQPVSSGETTSEIIDASHEFLSKLKRVDNPGLSLASSSFHEQLGLALSAAVAAN